RASAARPSPPPRKRKPPRRAALVARRRRERAPNPSVLLGWRADRGELRLEEELVDLSLIDRHPLLHADPDHLLPIDSELLRQFFGREVIRHAACAPSFGYEKARRRRALRRASPDPLLSLRRASLGPSSKQLHHVK